MAMKFILALLLFTGLTSSFAYEVVFETDVNADEISEIEEQVARAEAEAKILPPRLYGYFASSYIKINENQKVDIVIKFICPKSSKKKEMPGIQFSPLFSGSFYNNGLAYKAKNINDPKPTLQNYSQGGRLQVFFDMGRALRMKTKGRILITAGYYTNLLSLTEVNSQRVISLMPTKKFGELNIGIRLKLGGREQRKSVDHFAF